MDFKSELALLKQEFQAKKKIRNRVSKLDKLSFEILALRSEGASLSLLQLFLKKHRISANKSTISRWLKKNG